MCDRELRHTAKFDYKAYSNTGLKKSRTTRTDKKKAMDLETKTRMSELIANLDSNFFQIDELMEDIDPDSCVSCDIVKMHDELKNLRVDMVRAHSELNSFLGDEKDANRDTIFNEKLQTSKSSLKLLRDKMISDSKVKYENDSELKLSQSNVVIFKRLVYEVEKMNQRLINEYSKPLVDNSRDEMLKRKLDMPILASEFNKMRDRIDSLVHQTDVYYDGKEDTINNIFELLAEVEIRKQNYEDKVYSDLIANDLTDEKLQLAGSTKIDIGKFSGQFGNGDDYYTFKSKFLKAYGNHPKSLMIEWLKHNHLVGHAKNCVGSLTDIDEIWARLKSNYGNTEQMLMFHFGKINKMGPMFKLKSLHSKKEFLQSLINSMQDVLDLANEHYLVGELHYGPQLGKIIGLVDSYIQNSWYKLITAESIPKTDRWRRMISLLESQLNIIQTRAVEMEISESRSSYEAKSTKPNTSDYIKSSSSSAHIAREVCNLCDETHPNANKQLTHCKKFLVMSPKNRCDHVRNKKLCLQCLDGTTRFNDIEHVCSSKWICQNIFHNKYEKKLHILVCESHASNEENKELIQNFKKEILKDEWQKKLVIPSINFVKNATFVANTFDDNDNSELPDASVHGSPVFLLQPVPFNNHVFNFMYDSGCYNFVCRKKALDYLPDNCKSNVLKGPIVINGVGCNKVTSPYGHYSVKFPIHDGRLAKFSGICLDVITGGMPPYPVREVNKTIISAYIKQGGNAEDLPDVPVQVGGETDFLLGIQYNFYSPRLLFTLPTGLAIYKSMFSGLEGSRGCIGGPHELFSQCEKQFVNNTSEFNIFLQTQLKLYNFGLRVCVDSNSITMNDKWFGNHRLAIVNESNGDLSNSVFLSSKIKTFIDFENAGSQVEYRCIKCRGCNDCKKGDHIENVSLREEVEQSIIDSSVNVDFTKKETSALLPFIADPVAKLVNNKDIALKVYNQQLRKLDVNPELKLLVLASEKKLQDENHVDWLENLNLDQKRLLDSSHAKYYMPWRHVHNENSISTPVRIVFDASSVTKSGQSLNDLLAKGINSINSLLEIFIRFRSKVVAIHTDIKKMYNVVKLKPVHWTYQRYLWEENLDASNPPKEKIIKTLIYGVKSSGNQAEYGLRNTALRQKDECPIAANCIIKDTYVDDIASGANNFDDAMHLIEDINEVLSKGGFTTKGFTVTGIPPHTSLTKDSESINIVGVKWYPENDLIGFALEKLNFAKKVRGKRMQSLDSWKVPQKLTKRICLSKVAEVFDLTGLVSPIIAGFKLDLRELFLAVPNWDDEIPVTSYSVWNSNFEMINQFCTLKYMRTVVPINAENLDMEIIGAGDASQKLICAGCYVRFKLKDGNYSCQLLLSKSKVVPENLTLPRAELSAAVLNVHVVEIVKKALGDKCVDCIFVSDSEVVLYWLCSQNKQLKPWVRNRVIEVCRLSNVDNWFYINSKMNPVDLGTRKGVSLEQVNSNSKWINGLQWMTLPFDELKLSILKNTNDLKLKNIELIEVKKECIKPCDDLCNSEFYFVNSEGDGSKLSRCHLVDKYVDTSDISVLVSERLRFSNYLIDPNKFNFNKVVRIMSLVLKFATIWLEKVHKRMGTFSCSANPKCFSAKKLLIGENGCAISGKNNSVSNNCDYQSLVILTDDEIQCSLNYFYLKASDEVRHFVNPKSYENFSFEKSGIIYYAGRVLADNVNFKCKITDTMLDLTTGSFIVPIIDRYSPLSYSIINQVHWYHPSIKHSGIETTIRHLITIAHIIGVRDLVKLFRRQCTRCRYLLKRTVEVEMGPASKLQMCVAPPFYITQVDICGSFTAYSKHNIRKTVKVWIVTFVCSTTGMTNLKIMEGYDTSQFLMSFTRFVCEVGYPKVLLPDSGSQLVNGCEKVICNMHDLKGRLNREFGIQFEVCPVGGHNYHGKVERKIRTVQETMSKSMQNAKLSILEWETLCAEMSNSINNLPLAIGNESADLENLDLLTPNRLKLGRNNDRSTIGPLEVSDRWDRILQMNYDIFNTWWEMWLTSAIPKLMPKPKWFKNDKDIKVGDIVLFNKVEGSFSGTYRYGIVEDVQYSSDNLIRAVTVKYRNSNESFDRKTYRAVRSLIIIHKVDEINILEEMGKASMLADSPQCSSNLVNQ